MNENNNLRHISKPLVVAVLVFLFLSFGVLSFAFGLNFYGYFKKSNGVSLTPTPSPSPRATLEPSPTPSPAEKVPRTELKIEWEKNLESIPPQQIGLKLPTGVTARNGWPGIQLEDVYLVYKMGKVTSENLKDNEIFLIERACLGPCGSFHYRVIYDKKNNTRLLLKNLSNHVDLDDRTQFSITAEYDIPELHLPEEISVEYKGKLHNFLAEEFSPAVVFETYTKNLRVESKLVHPTYGTLYESLDDGYFFFKLPDHTIKLYALKPSMKLFPSGFLSYYMKITYLPVYPTEPAQFEKVYSPMQIRVCPPAAYNIYRGGIDELKLASALSTGENVYEPKDPQDEAYKLLYSKYPKQNTLSYDEFIAEHPVLIISDSLERMILFRMAEFIPPLETECPYFNSVL